ncbi:four helix bundle protein [Candidatus Omnitrophota bacterium]
MDEPNYRKLLVWQKAHNNALLIIELVDKSNPKYSRIIGQCLSAATSVGANIAEGNSARSKKQKESYLQIALNSSYEFDNWLQILKDSKVICNDIKTLALIETANIEVIKILSTLIQTLKS